MKCTKTGIFGSNGQKKVRICGAILILISVSFWFLQNELPSKINTDDASIAHFMLQRVKPMVVKEFLPSVKVDTGDLKKSNWFATIQKEMDRSEYFIREEASTGTFSSPNRKNNLRFSYDANGFSVKPRSTKIPLGNAKPGQNPDDIKYKTIQDWAIRFDLNNNQWGEGYWKIADNKAEYVTPKVTVQYDNQEEGMRQNFVVQSPIEKGKKLAISLNVSTSLKVNRSSSALDFSLKGEQVMQYKDLKVWDANGKTLIASIQAQGKDNYTIEVDDSKAVYPITIDPISTTAAAMVESNQASAETGYSVSGAGDVNGDGYSDVIVGARSYDNGQTDEGAAFIYHGSATGISTTAAARVESNQAGANMGISVSGAGDVNGDGYSDVITGAWFYDNGQTDEGVAFVYHGSSTGINTTAAAMVESNQASAWLGQSVAGAGDVNGDGYSDVIVGAGSYDNGQSNEGAAFVYHGSSTGISTTAAKMVESNWASASMSTVAGAGDVNGDGYSDVIVGAAGYNNGQLDEGAFYVYHGSSTGISTTAATMVESNVVDSWLGNSVSSAGDVNGDGYSDVIVGAQLYGNTREGAAFVYHGSSTGISTTAAVRLETTQTNAYMGSSVSGAGDVNGDGYSDVIVGAYVYDNGQTDEGAVFIYHGSSTGISTTAAAMVESNQASAQMGISVAGAGDVNGDGYSDIIVGASLYDNGQTNEGAAFVYNGSASGISTTAAAMVESNQASAQMGYSVAGAGDVNGDGYSDVIVGAPSYDNGQTNEGAAFVYHGSATGISTTASAMVESNQASAQMGFSVAGAGDVNGDGYSDVIVGAVFYDNGQTDEGAAFVYQGSATGISTTAAAMVESNQISAQMGISVAGAGDVNGDGYSDVIVGANLYDNGQSNEGAAFVYHGSATGISTTAAKMVESNLANATMGAVAGAGDVNGDGFSDVIVGANGYNNGQLDEGAFFVYHGSATGISTTAATMVESNVVDSWLGNSVSSAGDVNGDGYSDVIVGAQLYGNTREGAAFVYHGSSTGISTTAAVRLETTQINAYMGSSVSGAGDVNGDGYSDVIVGAYIYDNGQTDEGAAFVYLGSSTGISTTAATMVESNQASAQMGISVAGAGDVNGDGYSDIIAGAFLYDNGQTDEGAALVYLGNGGGSHAAANNIRAYNADASTSINQANASQTSFGAGLFAKSFQGRTKGKLVWEVVDNGNPFSGASAIGNSVSNSSQQAAFTNLGIAGVSLANAITKTGSKLNKVRVRVKYNLTTSLNGQVYGPWRYLYASNVQQGIVRLANDNTVGAASSTPTLCINTALTAITHTTTGATSIGTATGLPAGVSALWASNTITINGTPTASGTFNYSIPLTGGAGSINATGVITVNPLPAALSITPSALICANTVSTLTASSMVTQSLTLGTSTGSSTTATTPYRQTVTTNARMQYLITKAELNAAGLTVAGNITSLGFNITTAGAGTISSYVISMAHTTVTALTTSYQTPTFTTVYSGVNYVVQSGINTHTFSSPFAWDGTSNIVINICHTGAGGATSAVANILTTTSNTSSSSSGSTACSTSTSVTASAVRPVMYFGTAVSNPITWSPTTGLYTNAGATVGNEYGGSALGTVYANPSSSQTYIATATGTNSCTNSAATTITLKLNNTAGIAMSTPSLVCVNSALSPIMHVTTGATGIGASTGLPPGVSASWAANMITISGTPTAFGTFNYSIPLTGGCGSVFATGSITVSATNTLSLSSATGTNAQTICKNVAIENITYATTIATGATFSGLPVGVSGTWASNVVTISGKPKVAGTYNYMVTLTGGCGIVQSTGVITATDCITGIISGTASICVGNTTQLSLVLTGQGPWNGTLSDGSSFTSEVSPLLITVSPTVNTTYYIASLSNSTNTATPDDLIDSAVITVNAFPEVAIYGNIGFCEGGGSTLLSTSGSHPLVFNGFGQHATMQDFGLGTNNFTIESWINPASYGQYIISNRINEGSASGYWWEIQVSNGKLLMEISQGSSSSGATLIGNTNIPLDSWSHIAVVRNGTNIKFYVNGQLDTEFTDTYLRDFSTPNNIAHLGGWPEYNVAYYAGKMDQFRIWDTNRSSSQIQSAMNSIFHAGTAGLRNNYSMAEMSGNTLADEGYAANNATLYNGVGHDENSFSGGSSSASFLWSTGATTSSITVSEAGTYSVIKTINGCQSQPAEVNVSMASFPKVYTLSGGGTYCENSAGVEIGLSNSELGVMYQLVRNSVDNRGIVMGTGSAISFGLQTLSGTYTAVAKNVLASCSTPMEGTAAVSVVALPIISVTPSAASICVGSSVQLTVKETKIYCGATSDYPNVVPISYVLLNTLETNLSTSGNSAHFNEPIGSNTTALVAGETYTINLNTGWSSPSNTSVWIDYNQNGSFDAEEWIQPWSYGFNGSGIITIPASAYNGATRMRIRSNLSSLPNNSGSACGFSDYGAIEDFVVTISSGETAPPTSLYTWMPLGLTGETVTVSPAITTSYSVSTTNASGCTSSVSVPVEVRNCVKGVISGSSSVCAGASTTLSIAVTGEGPWSGMLSDGTYFMGDISPISVTVTPTSNITYTIDNLSGASVMSNPEDLSGSVAVSVVALPIISVTSSAPSICVGSSVQLTVKETKIYCGATSDYPNTVPISYVHLNTLETNLSTSGNSAHFNEPVGSNTTALVAGETYTINLNTGWNNPSNTSVWIDYNQNGSFDAEEWIQPWSYGFNGSGIITIPASAYNGATRMRIRSNLSSLPNNSGSACGFSDYGAIEDFVVTISGGETAPPTSSYTWMPLGLTGETVTVSPAITTSYSVSTTNAAGCTKSIQVPIVVNPLPEIPTVSANGPTTFCDGNSVTLTIDNLPVITQTVPLDEVPGATLAVGLRKLRSSYTGAALRLRRSSDQAQQDFGFDGNNLDLNAIVSWLDGADGFCTTLYDQSGNGGHVTQTNDYQQPLFVSNGINNKPTLHFNSSQYMNNDVSYQAPYSVIYGSRVTGQSERVLASKNNNWLLGYWSTNMDCAHFNNWVIEPSKPTITNQYNIYAAAVTGSISTIYKNGIQLASNGNSVTGPDGIQLNGSGIFWETSDCDFTDVIIHGSVLSAIDIMKLNNSIGTYYGAGTFNPVSFLWSTGATVPSITASTAGNYSVTVTNANGCSATSEATVVTEGNCLTGNIIGNATICAGSSTQLSLSFTGQGPWSGTLSDGTAFSGSENLLLVTVSPTTNTTYTIATLTTLTATATPENLSGSAVVTVNALPTPIITGNGIICGESSITLDAGAGYESYQWATGQTTQTIVVTAVNAAGPFAVTVTNSAGCSAESPIVTVSAAASPAIPIITGNTTICGGGSTTLTASSGSNISYLWSSGSSNQSISVQSAGNYWVTVTNSDGCAATSTALSVTVSPLPTTPTLSVALSACNITPTTGVITVSNAISGNTYSIDGINYNNSNGIFNALAIGAYEIKAKNSFGCVSAATPVSITSAIPTVPTSSSASRCGAGSLVLVATPPANSKVYWYNAAVGGTLMSIGNSYITPTLSVSTTYYLDSKNNSTGCVSPTRIAVMATINAFPTAPSAVGVARCGPGTVTLSATVPVGGTVAWYAAATGGTALSTSATYTTASIAANTTYYVETINTSTGCVSATRTAVLATVNALPALPTATGAARCGSGSVSLVATPPTGSTLAWYTVSTAGTALATTNSYITPIIAANTTYYVESKLTTTGCVSATRTPVLATINTLPTAPAAVGASRCNSGSVVLTATAPADGTVAWFAAAAGGTALSTTASFTTPSIAATTTYYVESKTTLTGCVSLSRTAVIATVNPLPAAPSAIGVSRCGPGVVSLTATPPSGTSIAWYSMATLGSPLSTSTSYTTPSLSANTTYYAETINSITGCVSATRTALLVTVNLLPTAPVGVAASKCGAGSVILSATAPAGGTVTWFDATIAGNSLSTTTSYTTPSISANTTYYVEAKITATGCVSATRTALLATINSLPSAPAAIAGARCGAGAVTLSATAPAGGTVAWYSVATAGTALSIATPYTTPSLTANTTYYVESKLTASGCVSATRTTVLAAVNALPAAPLGSAAARCGSGTVTLSATPASGCTVAWFSTATLGTVLATTASFTTPSITASTTYYAQSVNSTTGCISAARTAVLATINALPASPLTTSGARCGSGSVVLSATAPTGGTLAWYATNTLGTALSTTASYTTPAISSTTIYYVESKNSLTGCVSLNRSAVTAKINPLPATPTLSLTQPTVGVPSGTITIISSLTGLTCSINNGVTYVNTSTGIFSGLVAGTYNVLAKNTVTGCVSAVSVAIINAVPTSRSSVINGPIESIAKLDAPIEPASDLFDVSAYPNPTNGNFRLSIYGAASETIKVSVYDVFGRAVKYFSFASKPSITMGQDLKAGVYMIEVRQGKNLKTLKLVKF